MTSGDVKIALRYDTPMINPSRPAPGEMYEHYKKKTYRVFSMGLDASRQEDIVIYQALYPTDYEYFSRPLTEWNERVSTLDGIGLVSRFRKMES
jgi:hypothetical protein